MKADLKRKYARQTKETLIRRILDLEARLEAATGVAQSNEFRLSDKATATREKLKERELRLRSVFETAVEGIITMGEDRLIESFNPAAEKMFGYQAREVIGHNVNVLMPSPHRENHDRYVSHYIKTGNARIIGIGRETVGRKKDGTLFPIALSVSEAQLPSKRLFTGFVRDLTERKELEQGILNAADEERQRIATDLHDGVGSHLSGVAFLCDALGKDLENHALPQAREAREILRLIHLAVDHLRGVAQGLHPVEESRDGLMRALAELAEQHSKAWKIDCRFECVDPVLLDNASAATHLFRIAQEAVANAVRHGKSRHITIRLAQDTQTVRLDVTDDGLGMKNSENLVPRQGLGLRSMAYRAGLFGGSVSVKALKPKGTRVHCVVPLPANP